jgi:hypothetical protein
LASTELPSQEIRDFSKSDKVGVADYLEWLSRRMCSLPQKLLQSDSHAANHLFLSFFAEQTMANANEKYSKV